MLKIFPIMLALCFMLSSSYYTENYAGIIDMIVSPISKTLHCQMVLPCTLIIINDTKSTVS